MMMTISKLQYDEATFYLWCFYRIDAGDEVLKNNLLTASWNAVYTSKEIQNELIVICKNIIREKILRDAKIFFQL